MDTQALWDKLTGFTNITIWPDPFRGGWLVDLMVSNGHSHMGCGNTIPEAVEDALSAQPVDDEEPVPSCVLCGKPMEIVRPGDYQPTCNCNEENDPLALYNALRSSVQLLVSQVAVLQKDMAALEKRDAAE